MSNLEHLIENGLSALKRGVGYEKWLKTMKDDVNWQGNENISIEQLWTICQYVIYTWVPSTQLELCGDVISKEYLKEHIEACWINGRPRYAPELNELLSWIDDVPSAQLERKKGKWILQYNKHSGTTSACFYYFPRCSNCGESSANETNFCPNCGADMRNKEVVDELKNKENKMGDNYKIKFETEGFEKAQEQIECLADAYDGFPAQVTVRNCHDCTVNIYPSQNKFTEVYGGTTEPVDNEEDEDELE